MPEDSFALSRFVQAQEDVYEHVIAELQSGKKLSHWMWFIFPQFDGVGFSPTSRHFAIKNLEEAKSYLAHPILGSRLFSCAEAVMWIEGRTAHEIFGSPDDSKLKSCATLFTCVSEPVRTGIDIRASADEVLKENVTRKPSSLLVLCLLGIELKHECQLGFLRDVC